MGRTNISAYYIPLSEVSHARDIDLVGAIQKAESIININYNKIYTIRNHAISKAVQDCIGTETL